MVSHIGVRGKRADARRETLGDVRRRKCVKPLNAGSVKVAGRRPVGRKQLVEVKRIRKIRAFDNECGSRSGVDVGSGNRSEQLSAVVVLY